MEDTKDQIKDDPEKPVRVKHAHNFIFGYIVVIIFAAILAGVYGWQHKRVESLNHRVSTLNSSINGLNSSVANLKSRPVSTTATATDTLDNGTKISYPLNESNSNIIWWSQDDDYPSTSNIAPDGNMVLSDKLVVQYLSLIPFNVLQPLCGNGGNFDNVSIQLGIYNPVTKVFGKNQYENCITSVANSSTKYAAQAKVISQEAGNDLSAFETSIKVISSN